MPTGVYPRRPRPDLGAKITRALKRRRELGLLVGRQAWRPLYAPNPDDHPACRVCRSPLKRQRLDTLDYQLGHWTVKLLDTVIAGHCRRCGKDAYQAVPEVREMYQAMALVRATAPVRFGPLDFRLVAGAFQDRDLSVARVLEVSGRRYKRWEDGLDPEGDIPISAEKLLRVAIWSHLSPNFPLIHLSPLAALVELRTARAAKTRLLMRLRYILGQTRREHGWTHDGIEIGWARASIFRPPAP